MVITNFGQSFKRNFKTAVESKIHPHSPEEKANLFSTLTMGSTEVETINFINSIVYSFKPKLALETGTHLGCGTIAIATAMEFNGFGKIITVEPSKEFITIAKKHLRDAGALHRVEVIEGYSFDFIDSYRGDPFDFIFFDSEADRKKEFEMILERNLFAKNAACIFHDTSSLRHLTIGSDENYIGYVNSLLEKYEGFCFPYSRGFHFIKMP
jgi:predicted O-methyltransferase YrrM